MDLIQRNCVRALILTPSEEVLLMKIANPSGAWVGWITPGGGIDPRENEEQALRRELSEELGLSNFSLGPKIWKRIATFPWNSKLVEQNEIFFLLNLDKFEPTLENIRDTEMTEVVELRWWKVEDIANSQENFAPQRLFKLIKDLIASGPPNQIVKI